MVTGPELERLRRAIDELRTNACALEAELSGEIGRLSPTQHGCGAEVRAADVAPDPAAAKIQRHAMLAGA
ncbi:MAG TPA: hypothetical protein VNN72_11920 [Polyangiaceae bacterium]|nr:hypothetical protein [Polyangiaceae bacterium]